MTDFGDLIGQVDLLDAAERRLVLHDWNDTEHDVAPQTLSQLFESQVSRTPETIALVYEDRHLTYWELNARANRLAHHLIGFGIRPEVPVGVYMRRGAEAIVCELAVLKAGAAYVPLDPKHPAERLDLMMEDAQVSVVLTEEQVAEGLPVVVSTQVIRVDREWKEIEGESAENPGAAADAGNAAYVMYTSGSTGNPKGVVVTHAGIASLAGGQAERFEMTPGSRVMQYANLGFDASVSEMAMALTTGAALVVGGDEERSGKALQEVLLREDVTHVTLTPTVLETMDEGEMATLSTLIVAGEACGAEQVRKWASGRRMINAYGPTECTVCGTMSEPMREEGGRVPPIGRPIWNTRVYVLDRNLEPAPVGVGGELYITGLGLARGYMKRSGMTAERFVADPHGGYGKRMYRTGDSARWRADGQLEYLGREDEQVKVRGMRVELGEVEAVLRSRARVESAVVAIKGEGETRRLVGYVVPVAGEKVDAKEVREELTKKLPEYMVPAAIVVLDAVPLTASGKVDRKALPEPERRGSTMEHRVPRTPEEEILCGLFGEVLGVEKVGVDDDFFRLGGHSLLATRLVSRIRLVLGVDMAIQTLFEAPSVRELSGRLGEKRGAHKWIVKQGRSGPLPLSYAQQRLWFLDRLKGSSTEYNMPHALRLRGELDRDALMRAINTIVERHESLRTHFAEVEGEPVQVIEPELRIEVPVEDVSGLEEEEREKRVKDLMRQQVEEAFELGRGPMLRVKLVKMGEGEHILLRTMHHVVSDAWSEGIFNREFTILYEAYREGRENPLKMPEVQYADFAMWQRSRLEGEGLEEGLKHWKGQLAGIPEMLELPADRPRPSLQTFEAGACQASLTKEQVAGLTQLSQEHQGTLYMTMLAAFAVLLSRYSGQQDIVIGSPIANRQDPQLEEMIGFFVNTLVMRVRLKPEMKFGALLEEVRQTALKAYQHQDVPFEQLVEDLSPQRSLNQSPIFQAAFALQNAPWEPQRLKNLTVEPVRGDHLRVRFDLEVHAWEHERGLRITWLYNRDLFDRWRMEQMLRHYVSVLEAIAVESGQTVRDIDLLSHAERRQMLEDWNKTAHQVKHQTWPELFENQVAKTPDAVALVSEDQLTYRFLNMRANQLAHYLIRNSVVAENAVAVAFRRSPEAIVCELAVLKAGAAYVPLDPKHPAERLRFMMEDAQVSVVLTEAQVAEGLPVVVSTKVIRVDREWKEIEGESAENPGAAADAGNAAYVMYTSGSTGNPKGVVVTHAGIASLAGGQAERFEMTPGSRVMQYANLGFDASVSEMAMALTTGAALVVGGDEERSGKALQEVLLREDVTHVTLTPTVLETMDEGEMATLSTLIVAGEACGAEQVRKWASGRRMINAYGPTECTVCGTMSEPMREEGGRVPPIGRPIWNTRVYVLDRNLEPAPVGVGGELYITGLGLARGYMKRSGMTAERFVADPHGGYGKRMYRTGDSARWRADGQLEYLGREDEQVKVRGMRVELGEVEAVLRSRARVESAVVAIKGEGETRRLVGYVVPVAGEKVDAKEVREELTKKLPEYMVPAAIVVLDAVPLTASGKVDRKALPEPERRGSTMEHRVPRTPEEEILCGLFGEVLGVEKVGVDDDFFRLGGHSLLATRLVSRIRATLGTELAIRTLFEAPSVRELSGRLGEKRGAHKWIVKQGRSGPLPLSYAQQRLWFLDRLKGSSTEYNMPHALRLRGELDRDALKRAINTIVERHESLRTHFAEVEGEPVQVIEPELRIEVPVEDVSGLEEEEREKRVKDLMRQQVEEEFELGRGPMLRVKLVKMGEGEHILLRTMHHVVSDAWSEGIFNREFTILYEAYREGRENPLKMPEVQYADFAMWQRSRLESEGLEEELKHWKGQLAGIPEMLELPADRPRPSLQTFEAGACQASLTKEQVAGLRQLSQEHQGTLYMTMLAAFAVLLSRYSGQQDIVIGSPIANRQDPQLEEMIGFFVNTLVMRVRLKPEMKFGALLEEVRQTALEAYQHQDVPFEQLVEDLSPQRNLNQSPIFQAAFALQNAPWEPQRLKNLTVEPVRGDHLRVRFDLEVHAWEHERGLRITWLYNRDLFDRWRMEQMLRHYVSLLEAIVKDGDSNVTRLELLSVEERYRILREWNDTAAPIEHTTLVELVERQVARTPAAVAASCDQNWLTYAELNKRANQLAWKMRAAGVRVGSFVPVSIDRSVEMIVALLAVLKAGAAYVPIDIEYPAVRIEQILSRLNSAIIIVSSNVLPRILHILQKQVPMRHIACLGGSGAESVQEPFWSDADLAQEPEMDPPHEYGPEDLAYVIFTSGTTGEPKGVMVTHRPVVNVINWLNHEFGVGPDDRVLGVASLCFDLSVYDVFGLLAAGGSIEIATDDQIRDPGTLAHLIRTRQVTIWDSAPAALQQLMTVWRRGDEHEDQAMRLVLLSGDWIPVPLPDFVRAMWTDVTVVAMGGATEAAIWSNWFRVETVDPKWSSIPYGKPILNAAYYVLDQNLQPSPIGVHGSLYIGGDCLADGYLKRPELTAERFVAAPYGSGGKRMYRTGDLARWRSDGNLEFIGREDDQVKVRGFRIELGEVEIALRSYGHVQSAVVAIKGTGDNRRLVAYVVPETGHLMDPNAVRQYLMEKVPAYMVPAAVVVLDGIPLTANGKVDRKALPEPELNSPVNYRAPQRSQEELLCGMFAEVLGIQQVGVDDDFFALGGHSLMATRLVSRIRAAMGVELDLRTLFESPTVAQLSGRLERDPGRVALVRTQRPKRLPVSYGQRRLWILDRLGAGSTEYNMPTAILFKGDLDYTALEKAINTIVARHETLRTRFAEGEGEPVQIIAQELRINLPVEDCTHLDEDERTKRVTDLLRKELREPFDLAVGPMLRLKLLKLAQAEHVLFRTVHHIVSDAWSEGIFNRELTTLYDAHREGRENPLEPLAVQYADFALWQRSLLQGERLEKELEYWIWQLAGIPERLELPADRLRPPVQTFDADACQVSLTRDQIAGLKKVSQANQATLYMTMLAGFAALLSRYSGQQDIVIGSPIANRQDSQLEGMIGFFVNMLVMRLRLRADMKFSQLVDHVRRIALDGYRRQDLPFDRIVEALSPQRRLNTTPIFQVVFDLQNAPWEPHDLGSLTVAPVRGGDLRIRFDLEVHVWEHERGAHIAWLYNRDLFDRWRVEQMSRHYVRVLEQVGACPDLSIWSIDLLEGEERRRVLEEWTRRGEAVGEATLRDRFEEQVEKRPDGVAVVYEEWQLSYGELNARAERLADELMREGVGPDDVVALALPRSMELVVGILGVLKAGGAYLPLDPEYPAERLAYMMEDGGAVCVVTSREVEGRVPGGWRMVSVEESGERKEGLGERERKERREKLKPEHAAYVIYTSGSTGRPKGVVVTQQNVVRLCGSTEGMFEIGEEDVWTMFHAYTFDFSVWEMWGALMYGGRLVVVPYLTSRTPMEFVKLVDRERVTVVNQTPSAFYQLMRAEEEGDLGEWTAAVRVVIFGGEALQMGKVKEWYERHQEGRPELVNMYGITETTVHVSYKVLEREEVRKNGGSVIGRCIGDLGAYVLDGRLEPAPVGVYGELYITGAGLARGYLKRGGLTAERFVAGPYGEEGKRMYRTGDMARWRRDGELEYLGRGDDQVKVRGFRIELGEIEAAMRGEEGVREAVAAMKGEGDERRLVGYVEAQVGASVDGKAVRMKMKEKLPEYMVPAAVMVLPAIPLTENRKVDRKALPDPEWSPTKEYRAPRTPEEEILCGLFAEVLGLEPVGLDDNFFELGGDSIVAIQLVSRARKSGLTFTPRDVFQYQTPEALAHVARNAIAIVSDVDDSPDVVAPLTPIMRWLQDRGGSGGSFSQSILLKVPADLTYDHLTTAFRLVIERHDALRLRQRRGGDGKWNLEIGNVPLQSDAYLSHLQVEGLAEEQRRREISSEARAASEQLDPEKGKVLRAAWFDAGASQPGFLLIAIHHLAVDGVSWRILINDLRAAWKAAVFGTVPELSVKGTSFMSWARTLKEEAAKPDRVKELAQWKEVLSKPSVIISDDLDAERDTVGTAGYLTVTLSAKVTTRLLTEVPAIFHGGINDVLLSALVVAMARWRFARTEMPMSGGHNAILIDLESHGRHEVRKGLDVSGTVGWFTSMHPVRLDPGSIDLNDAWKGGRALLQVCKTVKEQLLAVPNGGIGFGMLRYLNDQTAAELAGLQIPQIGFNYFGRFGFAEATDWSMIHDTYVQNAFVDPALRQAHVLDIDSIALENADGAELRSTWAWAPALLNREAVKTLAEEWVHVLELLVRQAAEDRTGSRTPSDLSLANLGQDEIETLERKYSSRNKQADNR